MDGQSSRADLRLPPDILPITSDTWENVLQYQLQRAFALNDPRHGLPNIAHVNSSFSRLPCSGLGSDLKKCLHKPDFFLTCGTNLGCSGVANSVTRGDEQLPGDEAFDVEISFAAFFKYGDRVTRGDSVTLAEVAGGLPPHGSGDVPRAAGQGGNGQCPRVWENLVNETRRIEPPGPWAKGRMIVRTTTGTPGQPGMATIRGCRQMKSEGLRLEAMAIG